MTQSGYLQAIGIFSQEDQKIRSVRSLSPARLRGLEGTRELYLGAAAGDRGASGYRQAVASSHGPFEIFSQGDREIGSHRSLSPARLRGLEGTRELYLGAAARDRGAAPVLEPSDPCVEQLLTNVETKRHPSRASARTPNFSSSLALLIFRSSCKKISEPVGMSHQSARATKVQRSRAAARPPKISSLLALPISRSPCEKISVRKQPYSLARGGRVFVWREAAQLGGQKQGLPSQDRERSWS